MPVCRTTSLPLGTETAMEMATVEMIMGMGIIQGTVTAMMTATCRTVSISRWRSTLNSMVAVTT